jgi:hypothetical protein
VQSKSQRVLVHLPAQELLQSAITMLTKNFFPSSLTPTRSSHYPFLYTTHKCSLSCYLTGMLLNCQPPNYPPSPDSTCMSLNCNLTQTPHDMPSSLDGGLSHLGHCVTIRNHAYQKLFSFVVTRPSSLLPLPSTRIPDRYVVKLQPSEPSPIVRYNVKLHLPGLGPDAQYGAKLQPRTSRSPWQYR